MRTPRPRLEGAYIIKAAESRPTRVEAKAPGPDYRPPVVTDEDRALVRALLAHRATASGEKDS